MRRFGAVLLVAAVVVAFAGPVTARTYSVEVKASQGWTGTGILVKAGDFYPISASGRVKTIDTPGAIYLDGVPPTPVVGPAGGTLACAAAALDPAEWGDCLVGVAPFGQLVGMAHGQTFSIGDSGEIHIPAGVPDDSQLYLGVNDVDHTFFDNEGSFMVIFKY
jgi:hypothetical protein